MISQEMWVHGSSGQLDVIGDEGWGREIHDGTGLYLGAKVQEKMQYGSTIQTRRRLWVHFHIPTPTSVENVLRLKKVMLRFSTDSNPAGMYPDPQQPLPYLWTNKGFAKYRMNSGGAIIDLLHVNDAESQIGAWSDLGWQSPDITDYVAKSVTFDPEVQVHWGVGVSVRLLFTNQFFVEKQQLLSEPGVDPNQQAFFPIDPDWDGNPWLNRAAATDTKYAWLTSVGCEFISARP
jgi:hypothetical protein